MALTPRYDPLRTAQELRDQMASGRRRVGLLIGAGASIAAKLPGLDQLTGRVGTRLAGTVKADYEKILLKLGSAANIETVLDRVRLVRELLAADPAGSYEGISLSQAKNLDIAICQGIYHEVRDIPLSEMASHHSLASWIRHVRRNEPAEIFTTNYDLLLEYAFEAVGLPYFDGFVGVVAPFFVPQCVEAEDSTQTEDDLPPTSWTRLWKLHGSVGWQMKPDVATGKVTMIRLGLVDPEPGTELVIYPSREKLSESRRLPFVALMDRLRRFLSSGESLLLVVGYSFGDEHINTLLTQALRGNTRAAVNVFVFGSVGPEVLTLAETYRNLSAFARDSACVGGVHAAWIPPGRKRLPGEEWPFWDEAKNEFLLGDFKAFGQFLDLFGGAQYKPAIIPPAPAAPSSPPPP
jgi:hypothetical protein